MLGSVEEMEAFCKAVICQMRSLRYDRKLSTAYVQAYLNISRACPPAHVTSAGDAIKYHPCAPGAGIVIAHPLYEVGPRRGHWPWAGCAVARPFCFLWAWGGLVGIVVIH